jgi:excisionase family DNA binding protein
MDINDKDILSVREFAFYIQAHPNTVRKMIRTGQIASFRVGMGINSSYRIAKSEALRLSLMNFNLHNTIFKEKKDV